MLSLILDIFSFNAIIHIYYKYIMLILSLVHRYCMFLKRSWTNFGSQFLLHMFYILMIYFTHLF